MYTLDANVFVRDATPWTEHGAVSQALLAELRAQQIVLIEPMILLAEIAGPLSRLYHDPMRGRVYTSILIDLPQLQLVSIDAPLGQSAADLAADLGLRGMDAIYVAVAQAYGCTLVSLDDDVQRAAHLLPVRTPAQALDELSNVA